MARRSLELKLSSCKIIFFPKALVFTNTDVKNAKKTHDFWLSPHGFLRFS